MIPILYDGAVTVYDNNGIGMLTDATSAAVTEERNGEFELELEYPVSGRHYADLVAPNIILAVPAQGEEPEPFRIYQVTTPLAGSVTVYARHVSYDLSYIAVKPFATGIQNQ